MKKDALKISKAQKIGYEHYSKFSSQMETMTALIKPYLDNDIEGIEDWDVTVDYLAGDGFAFMVADAGIPVSTMVAKISNLKAGEKIKLSELNLYL